jgi:hypothetical protein
MHQQETPLSDMQHPAGIYQKEPTITEGLSHEQLLQLMLIADRFEVPKVQAGVAAAFSTVEPQELQWDTALQLLDLPPSCAQQPDFKAVQQKAVQRLQQQLGDLEEVWADEQLQLQQLLLRLPFSALLQLLQHAETRVATENTVVYTIERWYEAQPAAAQDVEQLQQLMHLVRVQHCTQYYAGTVMPQSSLMQRCFDQSELLLMHVVCTTDQSGLSDVISSLQSAADCPAIGKYPAWRAEKRPLSAKQPVIEWRLRLDQVQAAVERHFSSSASKTRVATSNDYSVQGQPLHLSAIMSGGSSSSSSNTSGTVKLGAYMQLNNLPVNAVRKVSATIAYIATPSSTAGRSGQATGVHSKTINTFLSSQQDWGFQELVDLGAVSSWQAAEAALRQKKLVHAGRQGNGAAGPHLLLKVQLHELL